MVMKRVAGIMIVSEMVTVGLGWIESGGQGAAGNHSFQDGD